MKFIYIFPKINLIQTRRVLELCSHLNKYIAILSKKLKEGLNKMDEANI